MVDNNAENANDAADLIAAVEQMLGVGAVAQSALNAAAALDDAEMAKLINATCQALTEAKELTERATAVTLQAYEATVQLSQCVYLLATAFATRLANQESGKSSS